MQVLLSDLKTAVTNAARNTSPRATLPVIQNILLHYTGDELQVAGTNLERLYLTRIEAKDGEPFAITVPSKTLADIVNNLAGNEVTLEVKGAKLLIDGGAKFEINGIEATEFPPLPNPLTQPVQVEGLGEAVRMVSFATSTDEARATLTGIYWQGGYMVATDGFRIARVKAPEGIEALAPASSLSEAVKHYTGKVDVQSSSNGQIAFDDGDTLFVSQLIEGRYPDYKAIIPNTFKHVAKFTRAELLSALKRLAIIARDGVNLVSLKCDGQNVTFSTSAEETGHAEEAVPCQTESEWSINFNIQFLRDAVEVAQGEVYLRLNSEIQPAQIDSGKPGEWLCIVMPMHKG